MRHLYLLLVVLGILLLCCEKDTGPLNNTQVNLTAEYVGVTEADIKLRVDPPESGLSFQLIRDDSLIQSGSLTTAYTTLYDDSLTPAKTYNYSAKIFNGQKLMANSQKLPVTTMDTTSHNFQWEIIEIPSPHGSGEFRDVAIINENDIWVVGEIYADSIQPWLLYNAAHWDGSSWELKRIRTHSVVGYGYSPLTTVFAFGENDVWMFSDAGAYCHWSGSGWTTQWISQRVGGIYKIWGSSSENLYFVGTNGSITRYNGSQWKRMESHTTLPIQDIWGAENPKTGEYEILCVASDIVHNYGKKLLRIKDDEVSIENDEGLSWSLGTIWFEPGSYYYIGGAGIFQNKKSINRLSWFRHPNGQVTNYYTHRLRGNGINDVVAVGAYGEVVHFNGVNWNNYNETIIPGGGIYWGLAVRDDLVVAVGSTIRDGIIAIGKRL